VDKAINGMILCGYQRGRTSQEKKEGQESSGVAFDVYKHFSYGTLDLLKRYQCHRRPIIFVITCQPPYIKQINLVIFMGLLVPINCAALITLSIKNKVF